MNWKTSLHIIKAENPFLVKYMLSKDIINEISLKCELQDIFNLLLSCKYFNSKIDNDIFWINKLDKDYKISFTQSELVPKKYYLQIYSLLKNNSDDFTRVLNYGFRHNRKDIIKICIYKNAIYADLYYFNFQYFNVLKDLDEKLIDILFNQEDKALKNLKIILDLIGYQTRYEKIQIVYYLYDIILPKISLVVDNKRFWKTILSKFREFYNDSPEYFNDLYNEKIDFYEKMTK